MADNVAGIGLILQSIGVISVALGLLLIYNTITAIITQQTAQIGELKAVGASTSQILMVYFAVVFAYGLGALLLAVPLGIMAANALRTRLITMLGADVGPFLVASGPVGIQIALCLLAPVVIATIPITQGARITIREAMSSYGLSSAGSRLDELLAQLTWLSRAMSLAISNAFRNKQRVLLTQVALAGAGVTFMAVLSARTSLVYSMSDLYLELYRAPIQLSLLDRVSDAKLAQAAALPGIDKTEVWQQLRVFVRPAGSAPAVTDPHPLLIGLPLPSSGYTPRIVEGRWLHPDDTYAVVLHQQLARDIGVKVGDWVTLRVPDQQSPDLWRSERAWQVVGMLIDPTSTTLLMASREVVAAEVGGYGQGNTVQVTTTVLPADGGAELAQELRAFYDAHGIDVAASDTDTLAQRSARFLRNVNTITSLLILMALVVAAVGGIALSGVLAIGVLERRREIGVLRAIGAEPKTVLTQFVAEGLMMGWLSWLIALTLSYPAGLGLVTVLGNVLQLSFVYQYSSLGVGMWLVLATLIGVGASWSPAQTALAMSVQESLAYE
jgi:putative ABC transport system permease protein